MSLKPVKVRGLITHGDNSKFTKNNMNMKGDILYYTLLKN